MRPKKSLGQNFLKSESIVSDIVREANLSSLDIVLEIGPGRGVLTKAILEKAEKVIAVEKDGELVSLLKEKFASEISSGKLELVHTDVLEFDFAKYNILNTKYNLVANIPYYITGAIFKKFLESEKPPEKIVMLVQKEVAERIVAKPARAPAYARHADRRRAGGDGKESILSISIKVFGEPKFVKSVPKEYFSPMPKVDSAILSVSNIKNPFDTDKDREKFFGTVKSGFAHKRKLLKGNLGCARTVLAQCGVEEKARAENLSVSQWLCLSKNL